MLPSAEGPSLEKHVVNRLAWSHKQVLTQVRHRVLQKQRRSEWMKSEEAVCFIFHFLHVNWASRRYKEDDENAEDVDSHGQKIPIWIGRSQGDYFQKLRWRRSCRALLAVGKKHLHSRKSNHDDQMMNQLCNRRGQVLPAHQVWEKATAGRSNNPGHKCIKHHLIAKKRLLPVLVKSSLGKRESRS